MRDKKFVVREYDKDTHKVVKESEVLYGVHWMQILEKKEYKDMRKNAMKGNRVDVVRVK